MDKQKALEELEAFMFTRMQGTDGNMRDDLLSLFSSALDQVEASAIKEYENCYCVCHSEVSSRPQCKHCERAVTAAAHAVREEIREKVKKMIERYVLDAHDAAWNTAIKGVLRLLTPTKEES